MCRGRSARGQCDRARWEVDGVEGKGGMVWSGRDGGV